LIYTQEHAERLVEKLGLSPSERHLLAGHQHGVRCESPWCALSGLGATVFFYVCPEEWKFALFGILIAQVHPELARKAVQALVDADAEELLSTVDFDNEDNE
jgi:hypothetical protein